MFCSTFTAKGLDIRCENGQLKIVREGDIRKLVNQVRQISWNADVARNINQTMHFVTERAVFTLGETPVLVEIAPGVDLERDILAHMDFVPEISPDLKVMSSSLFEEAPLVWFRIYSFNIKEEFIHVSTR